MKGDITDPCPLGSPELLTAAQMHLRLDFLGPDGRQPVENLGLYLLFWRGGGGVVERGDPGTVDYRNPASPSICIDVLYYQSSCFFVCKVYMEVWKKQAP